MDQPAHFALLISSQNNNSNYDQYNREKLRTSEKRNFVNWRSGVRISIKIFFFGNELIKYEVFLKFTILVFVLFQIFFSQIPKFEL